MNPNEQKNEEEKKEEPKATPPTKKLQRKLKFKTLDGNVKQLECDYDIKISELKKKLAEIYKIEPNRQRLLNKGKQFKDDEYLDKLVDKDDTTIHVVFRSEADVKRAQENAQNNNTQNNTNQNSQNQNANPFQNILSDQIRNLTSNIVNQFFGQGNNTNNNNNTNTNNNNTNNNPNSINISSTTRYQTLNFGEVLNLNTSPLQPVQSSSNAQNPEPLNLNDNSNQNNNTAQNTSNTNSNENRNLYSLQFPITPARNDKKYDMHLKNIEKELNEADKIMSQDIEPKIPLPLLNTTQNVFTAISRSIRKYVIVNQNILCHLMRLADLMEREQYITDSNTRMNGNKLLDQAYKSLSHVSKASKDLSNVIKSSNFNTSPNTGYIGIISQEIGLQSTAIPIDDLNTNNILSTLAGRSINNSQNNLNGNINMTTTTINLNSLQNNNQNQPNASGTNTTTIPIRISIIDSSERPAANNTNNNINNNNANNNTTDNTNNNQNTATNIACSTNNEDLNKDKDKDKKDKNDNENTPQLNNNNNNTNNNINNNRANTQNNNNNNPINNNNNNDINNLLGNVMNQLMTPENINSISQAVDSMMNNSQGGEINFGNLIGNLMNSLDVNIPNSQPQAQNQQPPQTQTPEKKEETQNPTPKQENENSNQNNNTTNTNLNNNSLSSDPIFKQLVENAQLRKEIKVGDDKKIGEEMAPNIEFTTFSNDIIANLTIQDIFDMYNLNFRGLCRLRKDIKSKYFDDNSKNDENIKKIVELLSERFILVENQLDKLIPGKEFILEDFFNKELKKILVMFIDEKELNLSDDEWEQKFRGLVIYMLKELINEIANLYESGEDGAKNFVEFNILVLIENFIGQKYLNAIQNYDDNVINNFVENLFNIAKIEANKNNCNFDKKEKENKIEEKKEEKKVDKKEGIKEEKKEESPKENNNAEPNLLSIEEILKIANKDKERFEKEDKSDKNVNQNNKKDSKKYSDFYYLTSLFK